LASETPGNWRVGAVGDGYQCMHRPGFLGWGVGVLNLYRPSTAMRARNRFFVSIVFL
jgi:hypothetical protein